MEDKISKFVDWFKASQEGTSLNVAPAKFEDCGYGLKALRDIEAEECILTIPKSVILSIDCAYNDKTFDELVINIPEAIINTTTKTAPAINRAFEVFSIIYFSFIILCDYLDFL